jgi:hypothetical protein
MLGRTPQLAAITGSGNPKEGLIWLDDLTPHTCCSFCLIPLTAATTTQPLRHRCGGTLCSNPERPPY